jgi:hypothetical protein
MLQDYDGPFNIHDMAIIENFIKKHVEKNYHRFLPTLGKRTRQTTPRPNYWESTWGKLLRDPNISNPMSSVSKKFRRRFRVPYKLFNEVLLPQCIQSNIFEMKHNSIVPVELRILISLRILGRDCVGDDCEELSFVNQETARNYFKKFVNNYAVRYYADYIKWPEGKMLQDIIEIGKCNK